MGIEYHSKTLLEDVAALELEIAAFEYGNCDIAYDCSKYDFLRKLRFR